MQIFTTLLLRKMKLDKKAINNFKDIPFCFMISYVFTD